MGGGGVSQAACESGQTFVVEGSCPEASNWVIDGDSNGDGAVDAADTGFIQARFGNPTAGPDCQADVNCDGAIDAADVGYVQARFGSAGAPVSSACRDELRPGRFAGLGTVCEYGSAVNAPNFNCGNMCTCTPCP